MDRYMEQFYAGYLQKAQDQFALQYNEKYSGEKLFEDSCNVNSVAFKFLFYRDITGHSLKEIQRFYRILLTEKGKIAYRSFMKEESILRSVVSNMIIAFREYQEQERVNHAKLIVGRQKAARAIIVEKVNLVKRGVSDLESKIEEYESDQEEENLSDELNLILEELESVNNQSLNVKIKNEYFGCPIESSGRIVKAKRVPANTEKRIKSLIVSIEISDRDQGTVIFFNRKARFMAPRIAKTCEAALVTYKESNKGSICADMRIAAVIGSFEKRKEIRVVPIRKIYSIAYCENGVLKLEGGILDISYSSMRVKLKEVPLDLISMLIENRQEIVIRVLKKNMRYMGIRLPQAKTT